MEIKPIRTKTDYRAALKEIETLMSARASSPEGERLDVMVKLVEAYEKKALPFRAPSNLAEAIRRRLRPLGGIELSPPVREPMREPPKPGKHAGK